MATTRPISTMKSRNQAPATRSSIWALVMTNHAEPALTSSAMNIHTKLIVRKPSRGTTPTVGATPWLRVFGVAQP